MRPPFDGKVSSLLRLSRSSGYHLGDHGMSWGVKTTCFKGAGVSLGGSGVLIGGVRSLRVACLDVFFFLN